MIRKKIILLFLLSFYWTYPKLVDIEKINRTIVLDIRYATTNNFTKTKLYSKAKCYLEHEVALAIDAVQKELEAMGLGLKIWDGYRPHSIQYKLWEIVPDRRYVGRPEKGSKHNTGCAVDLTIVRSDGTKLDMGTDFDNFTERAWPSCTNLSKKVQHNRRLLKTIMEKHGFFGIPTEWWHFNWYDWQKYKTIKNIQFEELE